MTDPSDESARPHGGDVVGPQEPRREPLVLDADTEHTVKNHLAVILGFCELLLADTPAGDRRHQDLQEMHRAARELIALFRRKGADDAEES